MICYCKSRIRTCYEYNICSILVNYCAFPSARTVQYLFTCLYQTKVHQSNQWNSSRCSKKHSIKLELLQSHFTFCLGCGSCSRLSLPILSYIKVILQLEICHCLIIYRLLILLVARWVPKPSEAPNKIRFYSFLVNFSTQTWSKLPCINSVASFW